MFENPFRKLDMNRKKHSSNVLRQSQDQIKVINNRLKVSMLVVIAVFSVIAFRLVDITIINQDEYTEKLKNYTAQKQSFSSPRGTIYDRNGNILVESVSSLTISYYPVEGVSEKEEWELAEKLVNELIQAEYKNACEQFGEKYHSLHEGYAILKEEIEEVRNEYNSLLSNFHYLWENIKDDDKDILSTIAKMQNDVICQMKELAQVGAVLMKIKNTFGKDINVFSNDEVKE